MANVDFQATAAAVPPPAVTVNYAFSPQVTLAGYDLAVNDRPQDADSSAQANRVVQPGNEVVYPSTGAGQGRWQPTTVRYSTGWIHNRQPLLQDDKLPGPWVNPPQLWQPGELYGTSFAWSCPRTRPAASIRLWSGFI